MAAILAVDVAGLAGLGLAVVVVQTLDPSGGLPFSGSTALAGQLWLLAQGGQLDSTQGRSSLRCCCSPSGSRGDRRALAAGWRAST